MNEPFLWAAIDDNGSLICWGHSRESACGGMGAAECIPLYREPTLADEVERLRLTKEDRTAVNRDERPLGDPEIAVEILKLRVAELEQAIRCVAQQVRHADAGGL